MTVFNSFNGKQIHSVSTKSKSSNLGYSHFGCLNAYVCNVHKFALGFIWATFPFLCGAILQKLALWVLAIS